MKQTDAPLGRNGEGLADRKAGYSPAAERALNTEETQMKHETQAFAHTCCDGHDEIGFNDPEDKYGERCPLCSEIDRLVDGIRDHLISLGAPADRIDGAGCDSGDPLDFTAAEITQAFNYFEDEQRRGYWPALLNRGDGVDGHYCIGRLINPANSFACWEFWNKDRWCSAGEVFIGEKAALAALDRLRETCDFRSAAEKQ